MKRLILFLILTLAVASTAHARWRVFGRNSGCQQQAACPCQQPAPCPCDPTPAPAPKPIQAPPVPVAPVVPPAVAPIEAAPHLIPPVPTSATFRQCGLFFNRGGNGGCPSCANGQCANGQCPSCPAAPAIVQPPCDACGDKICRPPENLPPPKPIPSPPVKVTTVVTVAPLPTCQEAATITARRPLLRLQAWNQRRFHLFGRRR